MAASKKAKAGAKRAAATSSKAKKPVKSAGKSAAAAPAPADAHPVSPLAPAKYQQLRPIAGVRLGTGMAGIKYKNRTDLLTVVLAPKTQVAGVFTRSKTASAPVDWCRKSLRQGQARLLVVNSGNANAFTGAKGVEAVTQTAEAASARIDAPASEVFIASTGVIGEPLPYGKIINVLPEVISSAAPSMWMEAARAIMTTDTFPKLATQQAQIDNARVTINGIAKGSGMIAPDMATMLSFVFTDAAIPAPVLQALLEEGVRDSFNAITVDSDTSTSDTLLLFATGKGGQHDPVTKPNDRRLSDFREKLFAVLKDLALQVVRDGEGARKLIHVTVTGAETRDAARRIALSIANSPLVKTAIAGEDANWGRVVMAVGKSGEAANRDRLSISFGPYRVAHLGARDSSYDEEKVSAYMKRDVIEISADVGAGKAQATVHTCDFTDGYIRINGAYRS
ncbi:MAG TPA: bifunctional glutamate N-acetyltransferase/amino-acid acetyltransferase ArgJ [Micropepsaceae bacterium]|nr:bifunctional glutamate N-acetyltransferase/amino-acid acetyltransferase ArgJ [Micropepsaceae bacterium]